ncbi:MAG: class I SAM-dependent methyltransferase [Bacillota bacterium]
MKIIRCPICRFDNCDKRFTLFDDRYGFPGDFELLCCPNCGHQFLECEFSENMLNDLYTNYYPRSTFKVENYQPLKENRGFGAWLNGVGRSAYCYVSKNVRVLDIGCGFGEALGYHKARGCEVYGVEADENIKRVADLYGFNVHLGLFDPDQYEQGFFDYVTMDQVIEHMLDPVETLCGVERIVKHGGRLILSLPNPEGWGAWLFGKKWINWHCPYHVQHFSEKSMAVAAEKAGLIIESTKTITSSDWLDFQWRHLLTYPQIGQKSVFWSYSYEFSFVQKILWRILNIVHRFKINHIVTRIMDVLGKGDGRIYFLRKPSR